MIANLCHSFLQFCLDYFNSQAPAPPEPGMIVGRYDKNYALMPFLGWRLTNLPQPFSPRKTPFSNTLRPREKVMTG
jgi:hypothetical protein